MNETNDRLRSTPGASRRRIDKPARLTPRGSSASSRRRFARRFRFFRNHLVLRGLPLLRKLRIFVQLSNGATEANMKWVTPTF